MSTNVSVIRNYGSPLVVTTKFDSNHEYDVDGEGEDSRTVMVYADITTSVYISQGNSALELNFGVDGDPDDDLEERYNEEIAAIDALVASLQQARVHLMQEFGSIKAGA